MEPKEQYIVFYVTIVDGRIILGSYIVMFHNKIYLLSTHKKVLKYVDNANYAAFCELCRGEQIMRDCSAV